MRPDNNLFLHSKGLNRLPDKLVSSEDLARFALLAQPQNRQVCGQIVQMTPVNRL